MGREQGRMWAQEVLTDAMASPWMPQQVATLEQTLGSETVLEAVKRNELEAAGLLGRHTNGSVRPPHDMLTTASPQTERPPSISVSSQGLFTGRALLCAAALFMGSG